MRYILTAIECIVFDNTTLLFTKCKLNLTAVWFLLNIKRALENALLIYYLPRYFLISSATS